MMHWKYSSLINWNMDIFRYSLILYGILCILNWSFELVCGDKFGEQAKIRVKPPCYNLDTLQVGHLPVRRLVIWSLACSSLHAKESLGKVLNPEFFLMCVMSVHMYRSQIFLFIIVFNISKWSGVVAAVEFPS